MDAQEACLHKIAYIYEANIIEEPKKRPTSHLRNPRAPFLCLTKLLNFGRQELLKLFIFGSEIYARAYGGPCFQIERETVREKKKPLLVDATLCMQHPRAVHALRSNLFF